MAVYQNNQQGHIPLRLETDVLVKGTVYFPARLVDSMPHKDVCRDCAVNTRKAVVI